MRDQDAMGRGKDPVNLPVLRNTQLSCSLAESCVKKLNHFPCSIVPK